MNNSSPPIAASVSKPRWSDHSQYGGHPNGDRHGPWDASREQSMQSSGGTGAEAHSPVLLVYYSAEAHRRLAEVLEADGHRVYTVDGRAHDASQDLRAHPSRFVVIDRSVDEVSVSQAVRRVGQLLPDSVVATVGSDAGETEVFRRGRRIGVETTLRAATQRHANCPEWRKQAPRGP